MIRTYQKGDGARVLVQPEQALEARNFARFFDDIVSYTLTDNDGMIKAVFGYRLNGLKQAEAFAIIGKNIAPSGLLEIIRFLHVFIPLKMQEKNVSSLKITVKKDFLNAHRLARFLGFSYLADLPAFYLNQDYQLFERKLK